MQFLLHPLNKVLFKYGEYDFGYHLLFANQFVQEHILFPLLLFDVVGLFGFLS